MKHARRKILESLAAQLQTLPDFAGKVWIQRIGPVRNSYPCITLFSEAEQVEHTTFHQSPRPQLRTVSVSINAWIRGTADDEKAEIDLDASALDIEQVLIKPDIKKPGETKNVVQSMELIGSNFLVSEDEPEIHQVTLSYSVRYHTTENAPGI